MNRIYENSSDNEWRYCLGIEGNNPLLCIGVNPSTAKPGVLDNTMKNVKWVSLGKVSKSGHPHHPLYLKKSLLFDSFDIKRYIGDREL